MEQTPAQLALEAFRETNRREAAFIDQCESLLEKLPRECLRGVQIHDGRQLMLYNINREEAIIVMKSLGGKWDRQVNPSYRTSLDYTGEVSGVSIQLYNIEPPSTCRIIEEEVDVPAHTEIRRKLVCK